MSQLYKGPMQRHLFANLQVKEPCAQKNHEQAANSPLELRRLEEKGRFSNVLCSYDSLLHGHKSTFRTPPGPASSGPSHAPGSRFDDLRGCVLRAFTPMSMRPMSSESRKQPLMMMPCQPFLVPISAMTSPSRAQRRLAPPSTTSTRPWPFSLRAWHAHTLYKQGQQTMAIWRAHTMYTREPWKHVKKLVAQG
eukprot:259007-Pelagomonas_calceolata.AAC.3